MELGPFSMSINVKDIEESLAFYEALGLDLVDGGHASEEYPDGDGIRWRVMQQGDTIIGLFEGMFDHNTMTFHPPDVRAVQKVLKERGVEFVAEADEDTDGPAFALLKDPDGNPVLLDQA